MEKEDENQSENPGREVLRLEAKLWVDELARQFRALFVQSNPDAEFTTSLG
jgi:hypothetical protein